MIDKVGAVVAGAGVVGLAVGRALALAGYETIIVEASDGIGTETSSRNSEVIHAGIYYPPGSLKALLCGAGRERLYRFCAERGVAHRRCGKLIVATSSDQQDELATIFARAHANGVADLAHLSRKEAQAMEPQVACTAALHSPSTGIIDSHGLMLALLGEFEDAGGAVAYNTRIVRVAVGGPAITVECADCAGEAFTLRAPLFVNAAGLHAVALAQTIEGLPAAYVPPSHLARGCYFSLAGRSPFSRLVYPVPEPGGLGVHLTLDLAGQARFGPDVEWIEAIDYRVDPRRADAFYAEIRRYWPALSDASLHPAYAGIRPKIAGPGAPAADFRLDGPAVHGVAGLVNLFGIESPGLTASLAIADEVLARLAP